MRLAVEAPQRPAGGGLERVDPAVAAGEDHLRLTLHHAVRRRAPLAGEDARTGGIILPHQFPRAPVDGDETRDLGLADLARARARAVAGQDEDEIARDQRRGRRSLVGRHPEQSAEIEFPTLRAVGDGTRDQFPAVAHIEDGVTGDARRGADADAHVVLGGIAEFLVHGLPKETAVGGGKALQHPALARVLLRQVGADEDASLADDGGAVGHMAERGGPANVPRLTSLLPTPALGQRDGLGDHVAVGTPTQHRPVGRSRERGGGQRRKQEQREAFHVPGPMQTRWLNVRI